MQKPAARPFIILQKNSGRIVLFLLIAFFTNILACGTYLNISESIKKDEKPLPYGGVLWDVYLFSAGSAPESVIGLLDLPLSLATDSLLLPVYLVWNLVYTTEREKEQERYKAEEERRARDRENLAKDLAPIFKRVDELKGHKNLVAAIAFDPRGELIASASESEVILWNHSGKIKARLAFHAKPPRPSPNSSVESFYRSGQIRLLRFSPRGNLLVLGAQDGKLHIWRRDGRKRHTLSTGKMFYSLALSGNEKVLGIGYAGGISLYSLSSGGEIKKISRENFSANNLALSPDGQTVAAANHFNAWVFKSDGTLIIERDPLKAHAEKGYGLPPACARGFCAVPDGKGYTYLFGSGFGTGELVFKAGESPYYPHLLKASFSAGCESVLPGPGNSLYCLYLSRFRLLQIDSNNPKGRPLAFFHKDRVTAFAAAPDGKRIATGARDRGIIIYDQNFRPLYTLPRGLPLLP